VLDKLSDVSTKITFKEFSKLVKFKKQKFFAVRPCFTMNAEIHHYSVVLPAP
jgi:hypothetical protein